MDRFTRGITRHKKLVISIFLVAAIVSAVLILGVSVNYDLTDYLPEDSESTIACLLYTSDMRDAILVELIRAAPESRALVEALGITLRLNAYALRAEALTRGLYPGAEHFRAEADAPLRRDDAAYSHGVVEHGSLRQYPQVRGHLAAVGVIDVQRVRVQPV